MSCEANEVLCTVQPAAYLNIAKRGRKKKKQQKKSTEAENIYINVYMEKSVKMQRMQRGYDDIVCNMQRGSRQQAATPTDAARRLPGGYHVNAAVLICLFVANISACFFFFNSLFLCCRQTDKQLGRQTDRRTDRGTVGQAV